MNRSTRVSCLFATLFLLGLPVYKLAACGEVNYYPPPPQQYMAFEGQSCSYYPGYGPQCAPGLLCVNPGFNVGFGVCRAQTWGNNGGWNNGGWNNGGWNNGGWNNGGWHGGWNGRVCYGPACGSPH